VVPYTLDTNDMRFAAMQGFNSGTQFFDYLKDAFDVLYAEGDPNGLNQPKMLSIGLHCRMVGRPARAAALARFLDYVQTHQHVWITRRIDIARHWQSVHPYVNNRRSREGGNHCRVMAQQTWIPAFAGMTRGVYI
jgi:allantoinase